MIKKIKTMFGFHDSEAEKIKAWEDMVDGMIAVPIENEDAFIHHMLIEWNPEVKEWCKENCGGKYIFGHLSYLGPFVYFDVEEDATAFKLMWS